MKNLEFSNFSDDHTAVEPLIIPDGCAPGDRLTIEGFSGTPDEQLNPKKKVWEKLQVDLKTNANGDAVWKDNFLQTPKGDKVRSSTLKNCPIK